MLTIDLYDDVITFSEPEVMTVVYTVKVPVRYKGFFAKAGFLVLKPADGSETGLCFSSGWHRYDDRTSQVECWVYHHIANHWVGRWDVVDNYKPTPDKEFIFEYDLEKLVGDNWQVVGCMCDEDLCFGGNSIDCMRAMIVSLSCQKHGVIRENCKTVYFEELDEYGNPAQYRYTNFRLIWEGGDSYD